MNISKEQLLKSDSLSLAACIYFESRGCSVEARKWVAHVVKNRVRDSRFPDSIPEVIFQRYQFSWATKSNYQIKEPAAWTDAVSLTELVMKEQDVTGNCLYFVSGSIKPSWLKKLKLAKTIGSLRFYRD